MAAQKAVVAVDKLHLITRLRQSSPELKQLQQTLEQTFALRPPNSPAPFQGSISVLERDAAILAQQLTSSSSSPLRTEGFSYAEYFKHLRSKMFGQTLIHGETVTSTQTIMYEYGSSLPPETVFVAERQLEGRGRRSNLWDSPLGALMFTAKFEISSFTHLPFVQYIASLAMVRAVAAESEDLIQLSIKWPNDLYYRNRKMGGVLCQSSITGTAIEVYVGMGVNVGNSKPVGCINDFLRLIVVERQRVYMEELRLAEEAEEDGGTEAGTGEADGEQSPSSTASSPSSSSSRKRPVYDPKYFSVPQLSTARLLAAFCNEFEPILRDFQKSGFHGTPLMDDYLRLWLHTGQKVSCTDPKTGKTVSAVIEGLTEHGYLAARQVDPPKTLLELHPDGNSFDFFKGLLISREV